MSFTAFDADVVTPEAFPVLHRTFSLLASGHDPDSLFAGWAFAVPRMESTLGEELTRLIDGVEQHELALDLCLAMARATDEPFTRYLCVANAGYCEDKLGNVERGLELINEALNIIEPITDDWAVGCRAG